MNRVLVVGAGSWGTKVARRIQSDDVPLELAGVVDTAHHRAYWWDGTPTYTDDSIMEAVEATGATHAVIATPPGIRLSVLRDLQQAGIQRVRVEKPLALSLAEATAMMELHADITVAHTMLFAPEVQAFIAAARDAESFYAVRWTSTPAHHDVSAEWDLAVHDVAVALSIGLPEKVCIHARHGARVSVRSSMAALRGGDIVVLDEIRRIVLADDVVTDYSSEPDPLGLELQAWAGGGGTPASFGRSVVAYMERYCPAKVAA